MDLSLTLGLLKEGLKLWNNKEATKYIDRVIKLEKAYHDEMAKPLDDRSDLRIDDILLQLRVISQSFIHYPGKNRNE
jgi:hypothetical protein